MDKREVIHALIDKLLEVAESGTTKELGFYYHTLTNGQSFDFRFTEGNGSNETVNQRFCVYFGNTLESEKYVEDAFKAIEQIKNTPDVGPKVTLNLTVEKARELGLIS
jgi:hypothetical protein